ncbi:PE domain-containing protein [Mycobacterium sp. pUA109]|uniref:PPE family protein, SVP subgroup n=1 Tax=Mycobacterium sp. pUA109 TaxID=3238982 RepID=UPI00351ADCC8
MSFVTARPDALTVASSKLAAAGSALAAQNAAAAGPTTTLAPAAADEVSALQAVQFAAYGQLYQSIAAEATQIHNQLVHILQTSAGSYGDTESVNASAATTPLPGLLGGLTGSGSGSGSDPWSWFTDLLGGTGPGGLSGNLTNIGNIGTGNWASAASNLLGMAGGGLLDLPDEAATADAEALGAGGLAGLDAPLLAGAVAPVGAGAAPVAAGVAQASSVGGLSVPPSWAGEPTNAAPARLAGAGWVAAPHAAPAGPGTLPAGMPSVASAGRAPGFGTPRYGIKPTVMPKPGVV